MRINKVHSSPSQAIASRTRVTALDQLQAYHGSSAICIRRLISHPLFRPQYYPIGIPVLFLSVLWANKVSHTYHAHTGEIRVGYLSDCPTVRWKDGKLLSGCAIGS